MLVRKIKTMEIRFKDAAVILRSSYELKWMYRVHSHGRIWMNMGKKKKQ